MTTWATPPARSGLCLLKVLSYGPPNRMTTALFKMSEGQRQMGDKVLAGKEERVSRPIRER